MPLILCMLHILHISTKEQALEVDGNSERGKAANEEGLLHSQQWRLKNPNLLCNFVLCGLRLLVFVDQKILCLCPPGK